MNKLFRKMLLGYTNPEKYPAIRIGDKQIKERVLLYNNGEITDITVNHSIVCERPFCIAILLPEEQNASMSNRIEVRIERHNKIAARLNLDIKECIKERNTNIFIFEIKNARNYQLSYLRQYFLMKYFLREKKLTNLEGKIYAALYSYPRKVVIISYEEEGYYNLFPMDFRHYYAQDNLYIFGLRSSNVTLEKILQAGKLVVCDTATVDLKTIYFLGKHHSSVPPKKAGMPFGLMKSEIFQFPVPVFSESYKEVEIINSKKIGSHVLMIGKVINENVKADVASVYHIHFFEYIKAGYKRI